MYKKPSIFGVFKKKLSFATLLFASICSLSLPANAYTTNSWNGSWRCKLTIKDVSNNSQISGYYPDAHGKRPAQEIYQINNRTTNNASGTYIYTDSNPRRVPTGVPGVWTGIWEINLLRNNTLKLYRRDDASGYD